MASLVVPTSTTVPAYRERVSLDGTLYQLRFRFNGRINAWILDLYDAEGNPIALARRCSVDTLLLRQRRWVEGIPPGSMLPFDTTLRRRDPVIDDFGDRVLMIYLDEAEVAAL